MKYRKKPIVVEAVQLVEGCGDELYKMAGKQDWWVGSDGKLRMDVHTLEGSMMAREGDWIIKGVKGELYPVKAGIFAETYEPTTQEDE